MGARTTGREAALQMLFAVDAANHTAERVIADFWREFPGDAEGRSYADPLVAGIVAERDTLDEKISKTASNWRMERMTGVDRNILRLATYELLRHEDVPRAVILDEAIELAKRYGAEGSPAFVNGILNKMANLCRPDEGS